jgi:hypothetical protein
VPGFKNKKIGWPELENASGKGAIIFNLKTSTEVFCGRRMLENKIFFQK